MKPQVLFDKVARHLFKQNKKCVDPETNQCRYRGDNNTKCAIGILIPNRLYDPAMETERASRVMRRFPKVETIIGTDNHSLANELQIVHDYAKLTVKKTFNKKELRLSLMAVAKKNKLSTKVLQEV